MALILAFGVDQRMVDAPYIGDGVALGEMRVPSRMLVAFAVALLLTTGLSLYLSRTFTGRAIRQWRRIETALALMGADPVRMKQWAFGIATGTCALAGCAADHRRPGGAGAGTPVHRPHLLRGGAGGAGQHARAHSPPV